MKATRVISSWNRVGLAAEDEFAAAAEQEFAALAEYGDDEHAAATRVQAMHRGRMARGGM